MRPAYRLLLVALGLLLGFTTGATQPAQVRMFCLSVRIPPATTRQLGLEYSLAFSSADFAPANDELFPIFDDTVPYTHVSGFRFDGTDFSEPILGQLAVNTPESLDANTNGIPDFYEVAAAIPATTQDGIWDSDSGSGTAKVTWQRAAGDHRGTVKIRLTSDEFGTLAEFTHAFEILEYAGSLTYTPSRTQVRSALNLHRVGVGLETNTLIGPLLFERQPTNRLAQFNVLESTLTNQVGQAVPVSLGDLERDSDYTMTYFGALSLVNGDPATPEVDYELFYIGIDDPNDADGDGIADLTDDVGEPPAAPRLSLAPAGTQWQLTLFGEPGVTYTLESARLPEPELWFEDLKITPTVTNQVITVPRPAGDTRFWRVRWP